MTDYERNKFIKKNLKNINTIENEYMQHESRDSIKEKKIKNSECKQIRVKYIHDCDKSEILSKIREFYDNNWYYNMIKEINNITHFSKTKESLIKIKDFYSIYKLKLDLENIDDNLSKYVNNCIVERIKYKNWRVDKDSRDATHDAEILRHIYYKDKYLQLKKLFIKIQHKHIELKQIAYKKLKEKKEALIKKRYKEDLRLLKEEDELINDDVGFEKLRLSSDENGSNNTKIVVNKKRKQKRTRIKKH